MGSRYGYFHVDQNLQKIWKKSLGFWRAQEKTIIIEEESFATDKIAKMHISRKRALKQSEEYYLRLVVDSNHSDRTHIKVYFEYMGDSLTGATSRMINNVNRWIRHLNEPQISFVKKPVKDFEIFFTEMMEPKKISITEEKARSFCPFCGQKREGPHQFCAECGSKLEN